MFYLKPQAKQDLQKLLEYIANDNKDAAHKVRKAIIETCKLLSDNLYAGVTIENSKIEGVRYFTVIKYRNLIIFYRVINKNIEIVRLGYGSRDWEQVI